MPSAVQTKRGHDAGEGINRDRGDRQVSEGKVVLICMYKIALEESACWLLLEWEGVWAELWTMRLERGVRFPTLSPQLWFQTLVMDADVFYTKGLNCKVKEPASWPVPPLLIPRIMSI